MKHLFIAILSLLFLSSCVDNDTNVFEEKGQAIVDEITVAKSTRAEETSDEDDDILTNANAFSERSILYISQLGTNTEPSFTPNYIYNESEKENLYCYKWNENESASWNSQDEYNFRSCEGHKPIDWNTIKSLGNVGNAFSLYAMYFPQDQKIRFNVEKDQRGGTEEKNQYETTNFLKSDIMGAYHATSSLYTRMRFNLFHLMVYLKVTLYVPVYRSVDNDNQMGISGFDKYAVQWAKVMNAYTDFSIEWRANRSSDTEAPLTQAKGTQTNIIMYYHQPDENNETTIDISKYYDKEVEGVCGCDETCSSEQCKKTDAGTCGCDKVYVYNFSVLFPSQAFRDKFLCFALKAPYTENTMRYYYFSGTQIIGGSGDYELKQGKLQHLHLYLPRTENEAILIGANILPWKDAVTDMTVTKEDNNSDSQVLDE